jgi:hypothetical protein
MLSCDEEDVLLAGLCRHGSKLLVKDDLTKERASCPPEEKASEEAIKASKVPTDNLIVRSLNFLAYVPDNSSGELKFTDFSST